MIRLETLFKKKSNHITPGLERMKEALAYLSFSDRPTILVSGTNGKGGMSGWIWRVFSQLYTRVGLYTSPHILHFSERVQVSSHEPFKDSDLLLVVESLKSKLPCSVFESLSFFELTTLAALQIFENCDVQIRILEIGLGGRLDACNAIEPQLSIVTSVDLDHTEWLGSTMDKIAREKLGIGRENTPLIWLESIASTKNKGLEPVLAAEQKRIGFELVRFEKEFCVGLQSGVLNWIDGSRSQIDLPHWCKDLNLYQKRYAVLALLLTQVLQLENCKIDQLKILTGNIGSGETPFVHLGRRQISKVECDFVKHLIFDVSHNPAALAESVTLLSPGNCKILCGFLKDKDIKKMISVLRSTQSEIMGLKLNNERGYQWEDERSQRSMKVYSNFASFWHSLHNTRGSQRDFSQIFIGGSFVAVGHAIEYFFQNVRNANLYDSQNPLLCPICNHGSSTVL